MGQYWFPVNLDKCEFIDTRQEGFSGKLCEQLWNSPDVGAALVVLLAEMPEPRGAGDLKPSFVVGHWAGDRVVLVGDYAEPTDKYGTQKVDGEDVTVYDLCMRGVYRDISAEVLAVIKDNWYE